MDMKVLNFGACLILMPEMVHFLNCMGIEFDILKLFFLSTAYFSIRTSTIYFEQGSSANNHMGIFLSLNAMYRSL